MFTAKIEPGTHIMNLSERDDQNSLKIYGNESETNFGQARDEQKGFSTDHRLITVTESYWLMDTSSVCGSFNTSDIVERGGPFFSGLKITVDASNEIWFESVKYFWRTRFCEMLTHGRPDVRAPNQLYGVISEI